MTQRDKNLKKLNEFFEARYARELDSLNAKINKAEKDAAGNYRVPTFRLSDEGFTQVVGPPSAFQLNVPAVLRTEDVWMKPIQTIYRILIPYSELEIGLERDPAYLVHLMDTTVGQAVDRYRTALGDENVTRFGETYLEWRRPGQEFAFVDCPDGFEFRFYGLWASNEVAKTEVVETQEHIEVYDENVNLIENMNNIDETLIVNVGEANG